MRNEFLKNLTLSLETLLNTVLAEDRQSLFRRSPRVVSGVPFSPASPDYHLYFRGHEILEQDTSTFRCNDAEGNPCVLRSPDRIRVSYLLMAGQGTWATRLEAWDKLLAFFFDRPALDPILPEALNAHPELKARLLAEKALLKVQTAGATDPSSASGDSLNLNVDYVALYHSGAVLERESLVRQRVIEYRNSERRVP